MSLHSAVDQHLTPSIHPLVIPGILPVLQEALAVALELPLPPGFVLVLLVAMPEDLYGHLPHFVVLPE